MTGGGTADGREVMEAMVLTAPGTPLQHRRVPRPEPGEGQVLIQVLACGVCRTDLHVLDGELGGPRLPLVLGHEIVGRVHRCGPGASRFSVGARVGVPWLGGTCGACPPCRRGAENLCHDPTFTGYQVDGGYAEFTVADEDFCFAIPDGFDDIHAAPLLCAGLIGYRAFRMAREELRGGEGRLGLYGFGAAAHILAQVAGGQGLEVCAFTRPGDRDGQAFARELGCAWSGGSDEPPPEALDAAILFAPAGDLVPVALQAVRPGGAVVCAGIHMSDIPAFPYALLWGERTLRSVANLTRRDGEEFFATLAGTPLRTHVEPFPLSAAAEALERLRRGTLRGAAVLLP